MKLLILYWGFLIVGYVVASKLRYKAAAFGFIPKAMMAAIYILVLIMGLRMGVNEQVTSNLGSIGLQSLVITILTVAGSMLAIFGVRKLLKIDRYGSPVVESAIDQDEDKEVDASSEEGTQEEKSNLDITSTLVILILVVVGMLTGCLVIARYMQEILPAFDAVTNLALVVFLCVLLLLVGFDLGLSGTVAANIKSVGVKAFAFPVAAVAGTLVMGVISGWFFGFSVREGLAISAGFGWYTYAPAIISSAGAQYAVAGAVAFMYNVIRETAGIILIPIFAKRFGYLEATGIPGVAAMDMCMPIVERSCRPDTVVYSFATGLLMCITTSLLVPLVMGA
ncbi:MAG: lysine exporter LysO family protein [Bacillota bacterium]|nr:lysine exporter LysO family protein [Bacillota bacterium]